jgi:hypothetical protein
MDTPTIQLAEKAILGYNGPLAGYLHFRDAGSMSTTEMLLVSVDASQYELSRNWQESSS